MEHRTASALTDNSSAVFLIGMPAAGKSTLGVRLARDLGRPFIDSDRLIENEVGMSLQSYLDQFGYMALRSVEEKILLNADFSQSVVATGGSVVYSAKGMQRLKSKGLCVYLYISMTTMLQRLDNAQTRGLACQPGTPLKQIFSERHPLYLQYADQTLDLAGDTIEQSLFNLKGLLGF